MTDVLKRLAFPAAATVLVAASIVSCGPSKKVSALHKEQMRASLVLPKESEIPELEYRQAHSDTLKIKDDTGAELLIMKAVRDDESGEMVAADVLEAAVVTARFRNVAERRGQIDLRFQVIVPASMQDSKWQLRFYPDMFILQDSIRLDPIYITGKDYRRAQLKGYQQYEKFLSKIISDTTKFININQLEKFLERNIPQVYAFKYSQEEVSDEEFYSYYGVSERQAVEHYTDHFAKRRNARRIAARGKMYRRYVKAPIVSEGLRLDTVMQTSTGDFIYDYVQTINTRPKLRKVDIVLSGDIWEQDKRIYDIPPSDPLTFYISSLSAFTDLSERYLTRVIERKAEANASYSIVFPLGKADIKEDLADNERQINFVKENLRDLMNNEVFDLDSIVIVANASPEGSYALNGTLSKRRGESVVNYFEWYMNDYRRELENEGFSIDLEGNTVHRKIPKIRFVSHSVPENWDLLDRFVREDERITEDQRSKYFSHIGMKDMDARELAMRKDNYYQFVKDTLYPKLRVVDFAFHLHRRGMVKDTVNTTELDERYMEGVRLLKDMEYDKAVEILGPYQDYNAAVAYMSAERNASALLILKDFEKTPQVNYLLAILYSRVGNTQEAVQCYMNACKADQSFVHRGNLDPEISQLIKLYGLNKQDDDEFDFSF